MDFSVEIKLVIRFSYTGTSGFKLSNEGEEAVRKTLYDPARLERRFKLFETLALPSLQAQTFGDFSTAVLVSEDFPQSACDRLDDLDDVSDEDETDFDPPLFLLLCPCSDEGAPRLRVEFAMSRQIGLYNQLMIRFGKSLILIMLILWTLSRFVYICTPKRSESSLQHKHIQLAITFPTISQCIQIPTANQFIHIQGIV